MIFEELQVLPAIPRRRGSHRIATRVFSIAQFSVPEKQGNGTGSNLRRNRPEGAVPERIAETTGCGPVSEAHTHLVLNISLPTCRDRRASEYS